MARDGWRTWDMYVLHDRAHTSVGSAVLRQQPIVLECMLEDEHLCERREQHSGSHSKMLKAVVELRNGQILLNVFRSFFLQLAAQPNLMAVYILAYCSWGRHRSEACMFHVLWNCWRVGWTLGDELFGFKRLCLGFNSRTKCGNAQCPHLSQEQISRTKT